ncbi:class I SAM-dependent methyltransferase [Streptomyces sp. NBC_00670]|jgi:SAM-dependent methyltransferase|uniref:class I SAM-dependent methyltransferase n=1 Tax=Streptomyces sp. NBC_00670 TaxID=2975804 RepID=UPI002E33FF00|nr:class I SAM-dependent methyltransferase [Streptomyces sp. NBC_00670]
MLDYDQEAERYDDLRGGEPRAAAAAEAVLALLPDGCRTLLDAACGTGIVTRRLAAARPGTRVVGADLSFEMTRRAAARLPGAVVRADTRRLPFPDGRFDAVVTIWLLHLAPHADEVRAMAAECARVLAPGGVWVTTVDKAAAHNVGSDIDAVMASRPRSEPRDAADDVAAYAAGAGLVPAGRGGFRGQGRSPRRALADLRRGWFVTLPPGDAAAESFAAQLAALPDQDRARPAPRFALRAFRRPDGAQ